MLGLGCITSLVGGANRACDSQQVLCEAVVGVLLECNEVRASPAFWPCPEGLEITSAILFVHRQSCSVTEFTLDSVHRR